MTQEENLYTETFTLQELHARKPPAEHISQRAVVHLANANYARSAMLAHLNAIANGDSERLYKKTDDYMAEKAKIFYKDYRDGLSKAISANRG